MAKQKSFTGATDAAIENGSKDDNKIFGGITDANAGSSSDPIAALLDQTNKYTLPPPSPKPIATVDLKSKTEQPADNAGSDTPPPVEPPDDAEETGYSADFIRQQNEQLHGKKVAAEIPVEEADYIQDDEPRPAFASGERAERRRRVISKFSGKFIDNFISTASVMAHEAFVAPKAAIKEHSSLMARIASLSPVEAQRLQQLDIQVKQYTELKADYAASARMDEDDMSELQECISDVLDTEDVQIHPGWLILIIVGFQIIGNGIGIFFDRMAIRKQ